MKLAIVIPAYNEGSVIKDVLLSLPKKIQGISEIISIVVNDGSIDNTYDVAKEHATYAINHVVNMGAGAATITGLEAAKKLKADIAVTIDADGQHNPKDIRKIIQPIINKKCDVVIGTRMLDSKGMPKLKVFGNWAMNFITYLVYHQWSSDSQSGMRAYNKHALKKMSLHSMGYEVCSEIVGEVKRTGLKLMETPIKVIYSEYSKVKGQNWVNGINILTKSISIRMAGKK